MPWLLIGLCSLIYLLDGLIHSILGPLAPDLAKSLALTNAQLGPVFSANLLGQCIGLIAVPLLGARLGQRALVLLSLLGFGLAQAATATAHDANSLIAWRLVTGFFLGGALPSCLALVTAAAPAARRGFAIMVLFTGYGSGATLAGVVASLFSDAGGWRAATLWVAVACGVTAVLALLWLREPVNGVDSGAPATTADRPNPLQLFSRRYRLGTLMLWLLFIALLTISYCLTSWLPTLLVDVGRDRQFAALSISIFSLGGIVAALGVGLLIDRFGAIRTLVTFLALATVLLWLVGQVLALASSAVLLTLLGAAGFFVLGAYGGVNVVLATFYEQDLRATGIGWAKSVGRIGTVMAPVLIGSALTLGMAGTTVMSLFAVPAALSVLCLLVMGYSPKQG